MDELKTFFAMGGHGLYIWLSYAFAVLILGINVLQAWLKHRDILTRITRRAHHDRKQHDQTP